MSKSSMALFSLLFRCNSPLNECLIGPTNRINVLAVLAERHTGYMFWVATVAERVAGWGIRDTENIHESIVIASQLVVPIVRCDRAIYVSTVLAGRFQTLRVFPRYYCVGRPLLFGVILWPMSVSALILNVEVENLVVISWCTDLFTVHSPINSVDSGATSLIRRVESILVSLGVNLKDVDFSVVRTDCEVVFTWRKPGDLAPLLRIF
jgi:hypothetical protein